MTLKNALSHEKHHHTWLPCQRELDCDKTTSYQNCLALQFKYIKCPLNLICRKTEGSLHQTFQNHTIPCFAPTPLPFNEHSVCFASTLSPPLFVGRGSVCTLFVLHLHYHIVFFVGRGSVCAWLALRPCKALGHTRLRHPCLACSSRNIVVLTINNLQVN